MAAAAALLAAGIVCARSPTDATITSGTIFTNSRGEPVHAHGAGIILPSAHPAGSGGKYYLVGSSKKHAGGWLSGGVNMYSSYDLQHWHYEAEIFRNVSITTPSSNGVQ